jgi:ketosteroid isomerase-like protein
MIMFARIWLVLAMFVAVSLPLNGQLAPAAGDQRTVDRDAIRNHIDKIFQAYIHKQGTVIRATHSPEWLGFLESSKATIHGIDQYMKHIDGYLKGSGHMTGYRMLEFDSIFYGDVAVVPYIAEVSYEFQDQTATEKLRVLDVYAKLGGEWNQIASDTQAHPDSLEAQQTELSTLNPEDRRSLLAAREAVWRGWFSNDGAQLDALIPPETIAINAGGEKWGKRDDILADSKDFVAKGGKLLRLEFPETEIQVYGAAAILYSTYRLETETEGKRNAHSGRATEIFVRRQEKWLNTGWHLD